MTVRIAPGGAADIDDVMAVMNDAFDPAFGEAWTRAQCLSLFGLGGTGLIVARVDAHPIGFALSRWVLDDAELLLLAVRPRVRRLGIGRRLIDASARAAVDAGALRLHLEVRDGNPARALYKATGFREIGRRRAYYRLSAGGTADALTLSRPLLGAE